MKLIDRYVLTQMIGPFAFFTLVFTGVVWLTQSLRQIDSIINNGQTAAVFLEFTILLLPRALVTIIPLSAFGAAIYTLNKLYTESELVVMMTVGHSPNALVRPIVFFGVFAASVMYFLTLFLIPVSESQLLQRQFDIRNELVQLFLHEGEFIHPQKGVTIFIRSVGQEDGMAGIFINDQRDPKTTVTYTAERALLLRDGANAQLALIDGISLIFSKESGNLDALKFKQFTYDLSPFLVRQSVRRKSPKEYFVLQSLFPTEQMIESAGKTRGQFIAQAHDYLAAPLFALVAPLIALGSILFGGFRRGGFATRIGFGIALLALVQVSIVMTGSAISSNSTLIPLYYLPFGFGLLLAFGLLKFSTAFQVRRSRRRAVP